MNPSELNRTTRRPVIASLASADAEFNRWVLTHGYQELRDAVGNLWRLQTHLEQLPHPKDTQATLYRLHVGLNTELTLQSLVSTGIYHPQSDERLLQKLAQDRVPLELKKRIIETESLETLRSRLADEIISMRESLQKLDLSVVKRRLIGQWIDRKSRFGNKLIRNPESKIDLDV